MKIISDSWSKERKEPLERERYERIDRILTE